MQVKLNLIKGNPKGKQVDVPEGTMTVGRAEDSDLIIASTRVSRKHCEITNDDNGLVIHDKGSGNGTFVNGNKVNEQKLEAGDQVRIGPLTFLVEIDGVSEKPAAKEPAKPQEPKPAGKPKAGGPAKPRGAITEDDILSSLERMAGGKKGGNAPPSGKPPANKPADDDDVLEISDADLLDSE